MKKIRNCHLVIINQCQSTQRVCIWQIYYFPQSSENIKLVIIFFTQFSLFLQSLSRPFLNCYVPHSVTLYIILFLPILLLNEMPLQNVPSLLVLLFLLVGFNLSFYQSCTYLHPMALSLSQTPQ